MAPKRTTREKADVVMERIKKIKRAMKRTGLRDDKSAKLQTLLVRNKAAVCRMYFDKEMPAEFKSCQMDEFYEDCGSFVEGGIHRCDTCCRWNGDDECPVCRNTFGECKHYENDRNGKVEKKDRITCTC